MAAIYLGRIDDVLVYPGGFSRIEQFGAGETLTVYFNTFEGLDEVTNEPLPVIADRIRITYFDTGLVLFDSGEISTGQNGETFTFQVASNSNGALKVELFPGSANSNLDASVTSPSTVRHLFSAYKDVVNFNALLEWQEESLEDEQEDNVNPLQRYSASGGGDQVVLPSLATSLPGGWIGNRAFHAGAGDDLIIGQDRNDIINGGLGADTMNGGNGSDAYYVDSLFDQVIESNGFAAGGKDTIFASIDYVLGPRVENLTLSAGGFVGVGNTLANVLNGNGSKNALGGGAGNDTMTGGAGRDTMTGGSGADDFDFNSITETGNTSSTRDQILDFQHLTDDIDLRDIDASRLLAGNNSFVFRGTGSFANSSSGEVRYVRVNNSGTANDYTIVYIDNDADTSAEAQIYLKGLKLLSSSDFML